jgi:hypothetical protein
LRADDIHKSSGDYDEKTTRGRIDVGGGGKMTYEEKYPGAIPGLFTKSVSLKEWYRREAQGLCSPTSYATMCI